MTCSDGIASIAAWLERNGVSVEPYAEDLPSDVGGRYDHDARSIKIRFAPARDALMTLAHEAGHWIGYLVGRLPHSYQCERQAFAYGWHVLRWFGAPVSREEWIGFERERRAAVALGAPST